jgi:translation initiation factor IF-3
MTKTGHAKKFLKAGDKVKVTIRFKGREVTHLDLGKKLMERFKQECSEFGTFDEKPSKLEGRFYTTVLFPKVEKAKKPVKSAESSKQIKEENPNEE